MKISLTRLSRLILSLAVMICMVGPLPAVAQQTEVPLYIKYRYEKLYGRKWYDASPERQKEFIQKLRKEREEQRHIEERDQAIKDLTEAQRKHAREMRKLRRKQLADARERRKQERERQDEMRKQALQRKRAEMTRRIQQRRSSNR